jgi:hypothetical protein
VLLLAAGVLLFCLALLDGGGVLGVGTAVGVAALVLVGLRLFAWVLARPRDGRVEVVTEGGRLWLPVARPVSSGLVVAAALVIALGAVVVVGVLVDGWESPVLADRGGRRGLAVGFLFLATVVAAAVCVPVLVGLVRGSRGPRRTGFGPDGVVRDRGSRIPGQLVPWDDVAWPVPTRRPRRVRVERLSVLLRLSALDVPDGDGPEPERLDVLTPVHASDPRLVALLVLHYRDHPEHRHELGTAAAEQRIRDGRLEPLPDLPEEIPAGRDTE